MKIFINKLKIICDMAEETNLEETVEKNTKIDLLRWSLVGGYLCMQAANSIFEGIKHGCFHLIKTPHLLYDDDTDSSFHSYQKARGPWNPTHNHNDDLEAAAYY